LYPWEIPVLQLLLSTKIQGFISYSKLTVTKTGDTYQFFLVDPLPGALTPSKSGHIIALLMTEPSPTAGMMSLLKHMSP